MNLVMLHVVCIVVTAIVTVGVEMWKDKDSIEITPSIEQLESKLARLEKHIDFWIEIDEHVPNGLMRAYNETFHAIECIKENGECL